MGFDHLLNRSTHSGARIFRHSWSSEASAWNIVLLRLLIMPFLLSRIVGWWRLWLAWRPCFGRSRAFWLRTLNGRRIQRPLLRLVPIGLVSAIRLVCGHTIRLRVVWAY